MRISKQALTAAGLAVLLAAGASTAYAGVVFELETTYHSGAKTRVESGKMFVLKPNMKMEIMTGEPSSKKEKPNEMIFRGDEKQIIIVRHDEKTYMVMDSKSMEKISGQMQEADVKMREAMAEMEKQMAEMDPEQRKMMEKMLKDKMPPGAVMDKDRPEPDYRKTDKNEKKNGYPCVRYDVYLGEEKTQELWVTDWKNIEGSKELKAVFEDMSDFYAEMMKSLDKTAGGMVGAEGNPVGDLAGIDGFPVVARYFSGGELESETLLKSVTESDLDAADFEAPEGYKLRKIDG